MEPLAVTEKIAAQLLGVSRSTLQSWRFYGKGPSYIKIGKSRTSSVRYAMEDLRQWIFSQRHPSVRELEG